MLLNPELFSITQSKEMGMWPPSDLVADSIYPYIKRMPNPVKILDVGVFKGENVYRFLEKDEQKKIEMIYAVKTPYTNFNENEHLDNLLDNNLKECYGKFVFSVPDEPVDIVCINSRTDLTHSLNDYYKCVRKNGIFCGNNHAETHVKIALSEFRRANKIGTPISVALDTWFWYVRG